MYESLYITNDVMDNNMDEMSVEVKVTYSCHRCHKEMEKRDISPFMEWHICDKCMRYEGTKPLYTQ